MAAMSMPWKLHLKMLCSKLYDACMYNTTQRTNDKHIIYNQFNIFVAKMKWSEEKEKEFFFFWGKMTQIVDAEIIIARKYERVHSYRVDTQRNTWYTYTVYRWTNELRLNLISCDDMLCCAHRNTRKKKYIFRFLRASVCRLYTFISSSSRLWYVPACRHHSRLILSWNWWQCARHQPSDTCVQNARRKLYGEWRKHFFN